MTGSEFQFTLFVLAAKHFWYKDLSPANWSVPLPVNTDPIVFSKIFVIIFDMDSRASSLGFESISLDLLI